VADASWLAGGARQLRTVLPGFVVLLLNLFLVTSSSFADTLLFADSTGHRELVDTDNPGRFAMPEGPPTEKITATATTFNTVYQDVVQNNGIGFDDPVLGAARRNTVQLAVDYIDSITNEAGICDILFEVSELDGGGFLSAAGTFFDSLPSPRFSNGHAFRHITTGVDSAPGWPDIFVVVDFGWNWNTGSGTPSPLQVDLLSVMIHELTHGLGILSLSNEWGQDPWIPGVFTHWDKFLETGNGNDLWDDVTALFVGQSSWLTGQDDGVVFVGPNAVAAFGEPAPIYAPWPWQEGSSMSHFDLGITGGAVMEPSIASGVMKREYTLVEVGALRDIGYTSAPALAEADFLTSSYTVGEGDGVAKQRLYEQLVHRVFRCVRPMFVSEAEAEDVTQDALLKVLTSLDRYRPRPESRFVSWVLAIAVNTARRRFRRKRPLRPRSRSGDCISCS